MERKNIALISGGDSGEYVISVASAEMIRENIDRLRYHVFPVLMHKGKWVYIDDSDREIPVDKNDFSVLHHGKKITFDCAFITIHGTPGEDGRLQAYFDLLNIPYTTAGVTASALTFNKYFSYLVVESLGYHVPKAVLLAADRGWSTGEVLKKLCLPVFVKPNEGGSSLGMSFARKEEELEDAIRLAFRHDKHVVIDEFLEGTELTCGVFSQNHIPRALPVTEIISKTKAGYFDYEAKYTPGAADEITPARIPDELTVAVQQVSVELYEKLGLKGLTRFDFIHSNGNIYFLEVNVTPGMTQTSLVPQQAAIAGLSNTELFTILIEEALAGR
ncbi:MAG: D-alanine--D-alanine ligase [Bacteroidia bacterium]|nr:MAG: D-alanine--D-alanine ligase [Bacteroidia bacterium]